MARWDEPTFIGAAGKIGSLNASARDNWPTVETGTVDLPFYAVDQKPYGISRMYEVNALDPGTLPGGGHHRPTRDHGDVVPAGRIAR